MEIRSDAEACQAALARHRDDPLVATALVAAPNDDAAKWTRLGRQARATAVVLEADQQSRAVRVAGGPGRGNPERCYRGVLREPHHDTADESRRVGARPGRDIEKAGPAQVAHQVRAVPMAQVLEASAHGQE